MKKIISFVGIAFYVAVLQAQTWIWFTPAIMKYGWVTG